MKNTILVFAIAFIALFAVNTAQAQNAHITDVVVSEDGLTVTGKIAGLGNKFTGKDITVTYAGEASIDLECYAASGNGTLTGAGNSVNGDSKSNTTTITAKNGNVNFSLSLEKFKAMKAECPGRLIEGETSGVVVITKTISFVIEGTTVTGSLTL